MREVIIIRHAIATGGRHDRHLFPPEGAPLSEQGIEDAKKLKPQLIEMGIDLENEPVAVSKMIRTTQTAQNAGLQNLTEYEVLNEVDAQLPPEELDATIEAKQVPERAKEAAKRLLENLPKENVWVTHGMLIAALAEQLEIPKDELYIPVLATITKLELP